ncbi:MAG: shikimate kinase [Waddliaceae bacterium]|nr:shikimate kinase [Waddliaceae bacterium]
MNLVLVGFKRCGKSTIGRLLAEHLGLPFFDTDALIEKRYEERTGKKTIVRDIAIQEGEEYFRSIEKEVIHSLCEIQGVIIATGGGAVLDKRNRERLSEIGKIIYLKIGKEILLKRLSSDPIPSYLLGQEINQAIDRLLIERSPIYEDCADFTLDVDEGTLESLLEKLSICMEKVKNYG